MPIGSAIRVTQARIEPGEFTGTTYTLGLDRPLLRNYFVMISPAVEGNDIDAADVGVRVSADPFGTGDLSLSGAVDQIVLVRGAATVDWTGTIQIVECERDSDGSGFKLLDVVAINAAASTGTGLTSATDESGVPWTDIGQVALFGGIRGGGSTLAAAGTTKYPTIEGRIYPTGTGTINIERWENTGAASRVDLGRFVVYVVEWGSAWEVNRATITGGNFGVGTIAGEWNTTNLPVEVIVTRANTWLWPSGYTQTDTPGGAFSGLMLALGTGLVDNATETQVSGNWRRDPVGVSVEVYALSHSSLAVDWDSVAFGQESYSTYDQAVDEPVDDDDVYTVVTAHQLIGGTLGRRAAVVTASAIATASTDWPSAVAWAPRHTSDEVLNIRRNPPVPSSTWAARVQSIDFGPALALSDTIALGAVDDEIDDSASGATTSIALVPDIAEQTLDVTKSALKKPRIMALIYALSKGTQTQENLNFALIVDRSIDTAVGANLDQWGTVVGELRDGATDTDYRVYIKARIMANTGSAYINDMIRMFQLLTAPSTVRHQSLFPGAIKLYAVRSSLMSDVRAARVARLMEDARPNGKALILIEALTGYYGFQEDVSASGFNVGRFARVIG